MTPSRDISALLAIMARLRTPDGGCPWDLEQTFSTIAPYTIEEAYEVADAIARGDPADLRDELGDLLLQVVFHARMAQEQGTFDFGDVVQAVTEKMIRRHPHVFGNAGAMSPDEVKGLWGRIKAAEKSERAARVGATDEGRSETLAGVPLNLPALTRAVKFQQKASAVGFDWNNPKAVIAKIREEFDEVLIAMDSGDRSATEGEIGDLLFAVANLARHLDVDPEAALRTSNGKFVRRFGAIEDALAVRRRSPGESSLEEMDALWNAAKAAEKAPR